MRLTVLVLILVCQLVNPCQGFWAQFFGLHDLVHNLALRPYIPTNPNSPGDNDQSLITFLQQFPSRNAFCDYQCQHLYNVRCMIVFGCWRHLGDFILLGGGTVAFILVGLWCCLTGIWTGGCWIRYISLIFGCRVFCWLAGNEDDDLEETAKRDKKEAMNSRDGSPVQGSPQRNQYPSGTQRRLIGRQLPACQ